MVVVDIVTLTEMTDDQEVLHSDHRARGEVKIEEVILATIIEVMTTEVAVVTDMLQTEVGTEITEVERETTEVVAEVDMLQTEVGTEITEVVTETTEVAAEVDMLQTEVGTETTEVAAEVDMEPTEVGTETTEVAAEVKAGVGEVSKVKVTKKVASKIKNSKAVQVAQSQALSLEEVPLISN